MRCVWGPSKGQRAWCNWRRPHLLACRAGGGCSAVSRGCPRCAFPPALEPESTNSSTRPPPPSTRVQDIMKGISPKQEVPRDAWATHLGNKLKFHWRTPISEWPPSRSLFSPVEVACCSCAVRAAGCVCQRRHALPPRARPALPPLTQLFLPLPGRVCVCHRRRALPLQARQVL